MKLNPLQWRAFNGQEKITFPGGRIALRLPGRFAVYAEASDQDGEVFETLAGLGPVVQWETTAPVTVWVDAPKKTRLFYEKLPGSSVQHEGEVFTNIDRMPMESGSVLEVKAALRRFALEQRGMLDAIRAEKAALERERKAVEPAPAAEPAPAPEPVPAPEPDAGAAE